MEFRFYLFQKMDINRNFTGYYGRLLKDLINLISPLKITVPLAMITLGISLLTLINKTVFQYIFTVKNSLKVGLK